MRFKTFKLLALVIALALLPHSAHAAEIVCLQRHGDPPDEDVARKLWPSGFRPTMNSSCNIALMHGTIEKGDYERYRSFYRQHHRALQNVCLVSPGGDAEEATKIGRLVRRYLTSVTAPTRFGDDASPFRLFKPPSFKPGEPVEHLCVGSTCICASACALVWFGGVNRSGQVGLHRPKRTDAEYKALAPADASAVYKRALQEISRYLEEMEAPRPLIDGMVATSSSEIRWVKDEDQLEYPPSFIEWVDASCGAFTSQERNALNELGTREVFAKGRPGDDLQPLTPTEKMLRKMLSEKSFAWAKCRNILVNARRDALAAP